MFWEDLLGGESKKCEKEYSKAVQEGSRGGGGLEVFLEETIGTVVPSTKEYQSRIAGLRAGREQRSQHGSERDSRGGSYSSGSSSHGASSTSRSASVATIVIVAFVVLFTIGLEISLSIIGRLGLGMGNGVTLDSAKAIIPGLLDRLYADLNQGNPSAVLGLLSPSLASNTNSLDFICRPFAYRAHYVEGITERTGQGFQAKVHVLLQPVEERRYVLHFIASGNQVVLSDVSYEGEDWIAPARERALNLGTKFAYAAKAGRMDVLREITTRSLDLSQLSDPEYQARLREMGELRFESVDVTSHFGLKYAVQFYSSRGICSDIWNFLVDNVRGEDKIVKWEFTPLVGCYALFKSYSATEDPNLESYTLERFGLATASRK